MPAFYEAGPNGVWVFLLLTLTLGGLAASAAGRAIAQTWRPFWQVPLYAGLLMLAVRFLHFSLFDEPLLTPGACAVDYVVLLVAAVVGHRMMRGEQLAGQYYWLFERSGPLGWRRKST